MTRFFKGNIASGILFASDVEGKNISTKQNISFTLKTLT